MDPPSRGGVGEGSRMGGEYHALAKLETTRETVSPARVRRPAKRGRQPIHPRTQLAMATLAARRGLRSRKARGASSGSVRPAAEHPGPRPEYWSVETSIQPGSKYVEAEPWTPLGLAEELHGLRRLQGEPSSRREFHCVPLVANRI
jgi:hypothetical protein